MTLFKALRRFGLPASAWLFSFAIANGPGALAQENGDAVKGAIQVQQICGACHGVARGEASKNVLAPNLSDVANTNGISGTAINVALLTPHYDMPNLILNAQERSDVIAFILGLKTPR